MHRIIVAVFAFVTAVSPKLGQAQVIDSIAGDGGPLLAFPRGILATSSEVVVADQTTNIVRHVDLTGGVISILAGNGDLNPAVEGAVPDMSSLGRPVDVARDPLNGNLIILESFPSGRLVQINGAGVVERLAGTGAPGGGGDGGPALSASVEVAVAVDFDAAGNLYILESPGADSFPPAVPFGRVRKIERATGDITTVAGSRFPGFFGDGSPAASARFFRPEGLAVTPTGDIYIADTGNARIRLVDSGDGEITTVAGGGSLPGDGPATSVSLTLPRALAIDDDGRLLIAEAARITRYDPVAGTVTRLAGTGAVGFGGDGGDPSSARINNPRGIAASNGKIYVADTGNRRIREIDLMPMSTATIGFERMRVKAADISGTSLPDSVKGNYLVAKKVTEDATTYDVQYKIGGGGLVKTTDPLDVRPLPLRTGFDDSATSQVRSAFEAKGLALESFIDVLGWKFQTGFIDSWMAGMSIEPNAPCSSGDASCTTAFRESLRFSSGFGQDGRTIRGLRGLFQQDQGPGNKDLDDNEMILFVTDGDVTEVDVEITYRKDAQKVLTNSATLHVIGLDVDESGNLIVLDVQTQSGTDTSRAFSLAADRSIPIVGIAVGEGDFVRLEVALTTGPGVMSPVCSCWPDGLAEYWSQPIADCAVTDVCWDPLDNTVADTPGQVICAAEDGDQLGTTLRQLRGIGERQCLVFESNVEQTRVLAEPDYGVCVTELQAFIDAGCPR